LALAAIVRKRADGVLFIADPIFFIQLKRMVDLVARLPPVVAMLRSCCDAPDVAMAETALSQINEAFETLRDGGNAPSAEYYERQTISQSHDAPGSQIDRAPSRAHSSVPDS
jgi:GTP cyclohydrolase III